MTLHVRVGALLLSLSLTTALILLWRTHFSARQFAHDLFYWRGQTWSFDAGWLVRRQLAAFTLIYGLIGGAFVLNAIHPLVVVAPAALLALGVTVIDRRLARRVGDAGISRDEIHHLSRWRWFNGHKAHEFTKQIEAGEISWVPSMLTVVSVPLSMLAIGLFWLIFGQLYPGSIWVFALLSALTIGIPPLLTCMLGPTPSPLDQPR